MYRIVTAAVVLLLAALAPLTARASGAVCTINTGLDPACPLTALGVQSSAQIPNATADIRSDTIFYSFAWHANRQIRIWLPLYSHLNILHEGDAFGTRDLGMSYAQILRVHGRLTQVGGASATFPTGADAFSNGRTQLAPTYSLSYALGNRIALVAIGKYRFGIGGTKLPFAPRTQESTVIPRVIVNWPRTGLYGALDLQASNVTGDERYQALRSDAILGIVRGHYALSLTYGIPATSYTYAHVFERTLRVDFSVRP